MEADLRDIDSILAGSILAGYAMPCLHRKVGSAHNEASFSRPQNGGVPSAACKTRLKMMGFPAAVFTSDKIVGGGWHDW